MITISHRTGKPTLSLTQPHSHNPSHLRLFQQKHTYGKAPQPPHTRTKTRTCCTLRSRPGAPRPPQHPTTRTLPLDNLRHLAAAHHHVLRVCSRLPGLVLEARLGLADLLKKRHVQLEGDGQRALEQRGCPPHDSLPLTVKPPLNCYPLRVRAHSSSQEGWAQRRVTPPQNSRESPLAALWTSAYTHDTISPNTNARPRTFRRRSVILGRVVKMNASTMNMVRRPTEVSGVTSPYLQTQQRSSEHPSTM